MELSIEELQEIVNKRCMDIGEQSMKIYNNICPICSEGITNNNYKILHPCSHIFCNICTVQIAPMNMSIRIACPICRNPSKWIDSVNNNLRQISSIQNNNFQNNTIFNLNNLPLMPIPMARMRTIGISHRNNNLIINESLVSKPPLFIETFLNQNNNLLNFYEKI